ncbi:MAG: family metallophosphoesterase [Pseudonocardiales bacterium]|nr:family metallophosphoesterase [Pseudonocardiales bacterium]
MNHQVRRDLIDGQPGGDVLLTIAHLSDIHVCDHQSPARVEFLDRWADPDSPLAAQLGEIGTYRPQDMLTAQVADAMVQAVNALQVGPFGGGPIDLALVTGDNTDNAQANELAWYLAILDGGIVHPDSGDLTRYEGVADEVCFDERFWHPESALADLPRSRWGLPTVPGLLDAVRRPFTASGLDLPWLGVHGNHDRLLQGTVPSVGPLAKASTGTAKIYATPDQWTQDDILRIIVGLADCDEQALAMLAHSHRRSVTSDGGRRILDPTEFVAAHLTTEARPPGHGFSADLRSYYRHDTAGVTILTLDTVNPHGGWQGSLGETQLAWLQAELSEADSDRRYVILASHHPLHDLTNGRSDGADRRVLNAELDRCLAEHPSVVLWLNGHTHRTAVHRHGSWWEVTAPSLIDWPQQGRIVELLAADGVLTIAVTMLDHAGASPWRGSTGSTRELAALSRQLAGADWQGGLSREGLAVDRNATLLLPDPWR